MKESGSLPTQFSDLYDTVFENAAVVLALVDENRKVLNINRTGLDMLSKKKEAIINRLAGEVLDCTNAWSRGKLVCGVGKHCKNCILRGSIANTFETGETVYKKEGHLDIDIDGETIRLMLLITTAVVTIEDKKYVLLTIDDITKLKEKEDKLRKAIATKDKFFSIISHDLRGPIGGILGLSEIIQEDIEEDNFDNFKGYMEMMHHEIENTHKLLENLLLWSRNQKGDIELKPELLDPKTIAKDILSLLKGLAEKKGIQIKNNIPENLLVKADKQMLSTVIRNLVSNAIKFTNQDDVITINAKPKKKYIEFSVADTGVGIPEETQANLFNISVNSSTRGTGNEKGTGLGLMLCKEFVEKHKGEIWVKSKLNEGTTVFFTFPIKE